MRLLDFFGREAGQRRRAALAELGRDAEQYIPPNLRPLVGLLSEMTPTAANERAAMAPAAAFNYDDNAQQPQGLLQ